MKTLISNWLPSIVVVLGAVLVGCAEQYSLWFDAAAYFIGWLVAFSGVVAYKDLYQRVEITAVQVAFMFAVLQVFFPQTLILQYLTWYL